jgi:hypothetical protein
MAARRKLYRTQCRVPLLIRPRSEVLSCFLSTNEPGIKVDSVNIWRRRLWHVEQHRVPLLIRLRSAVLSCFLRTNKPSIKVDPVNVWRGRLWPIFEQQTSTRPFPVDRLIQIAVITGAFLPETKCRHTRSLSNGQLPNQIAARFRQPPFHGQRNRRTLTNDNAWNRGQPPFLKAEMASNPVHNRGQSFRLNQCLDRIPSTNACVERTSSSGRA